MTSETRCPFYGFYQGGKILVSTSHDRCALNREDLPCQMKQTGGESDWKKCMFNFNGVFVKFDDYVVFNGAQDIPFREWSRRFEGLDIQKL